MFSKYLQILPSTPRQPALLIIQFSVCLTVIIVDCNSVLENKYDDDDDDDEVG